MGWLGPRIVIISGGVGDRYHRPALPSVPPHEPQPLIFPTAAPPAKRTDAPGDTLARKLHTQNCLANRRKRVPQLVLAVHRCGPIQTGTRG